MKQIITIEQLYSLSQKGAGRLNDWFVKKGVMTKGERELMKDIFHEAFGFKMLTIGEMIEFLGWKIFLIHQHINNIVSIERISNKKGERAQYFGKSLCDALWEAVKKVLED